MQSEKLIIFLKKMRNLEEIEEKMNSLWSFLEIMVECEGVKGIWQIIDARIFKRKRHEGFKFLF